MNSSTCFIPPKSLSKKQNSYPPFPLCFLPFIIPILSFPATCLEIVQGSTSYTDKCEGVGRTLLFGILLSISSEGW